MKINIETPNTKNSNAPTRVPGTGRAGMGRGVAFYLATAFNSQLVWDTSKVTGLNHAFRSASAFNSELAWDTSKVLGMGWTFFETEAFNSELNWVLELLDHQAGDVVCEARHCVCECGLGDGRETSEC